MERSPVLQVNGVSHWFGKNRVLHDVNLEIGRGQIVALVGPSGCGKSTLLRAIVGTHPPREGSIVVYSGAGGLARVVHQPGRDRGIVYQHYSLFPFLTAQQNVAFGLMLDQTNLAYRAFLYPQWRKLRKEHMAKAADLLERVGLAQAMKLYPTEMSGGMQQRVAIAQALIMEPDILLLDEPFGALDEAMREELQRMLLSLYLENIEAYARGEKVPHTILIVTHELNEAIYVSVRVAGLSQYWNWREQGHETRPGATIVYDRPAPVFRPEDVREFAQFKEQREEIRNVVFDPSSNVAPPKHCTYWDEVESGGVKAFMV